jgi:hypothetical protein
MRELHEGMTRDLTQRLKSSDPHEGRAGLPFIPREGRRTGPSWVR